MNIIHKLDKQFGHYIPNNIILYLIAGQAIAFVLVNARPDLASFFVLTGNKVMQGEWWRVITFIFDPPSDSPLFLLLEWYFLYLIGPALEKVWGALRLLTYFLIPYILAIIVSFIFPETIIGSGILLSSLFFAFAYLFPEMKFLLLFIIPVKAKWLAYVGWFFIILSLLVSPIPEKVLTLISISNFLVFFGEDLFSSMRGSAHHATYTAKVATTKQKAYHTCYVCGVNEVKDPYMEIRYCDDCIPSTCYCGEHAKGHKHRKAN